MLAVTLFPTISVLRGGPRSGTSPAHGLPAPPSAPTAAPASFPVAAPSAPIRAGPAGASARGPGAARAASAVPASAADAADLDPPAEAAGAGPVRNPVLEEIEKVEPRFTRLAKLRRWEGSVAVPRAGERGTGAWAAGTSDS
jgi:hypothetical protein